MTSTPAGWYDDGHGSTRWWDGAQWTQWVRDKPGGTRSEDPPGTLAPPARESPSSGGPASSESDPIEQLRKLGELRDAGVITPEQFEAKRVELLGRI